MTRPVALLLLAFLAACGGGDDDGPPPAEACNELAAVVCQKYFECFSAEERAAAMIPATEAECVTATRAEFDCAVQTAESECDEGEVYDPASARECLDQYDALACDVVRDGPDATDTPACDQTCQ